MFDTNVQKQLQKIAELAWNIRNLAVRAKESQTPITDKNLVFLLDRANNIIERIDTASAQLAEIKNKIG